MGRVVPTPGSGATDEWTRAHPGAIERKPTMSDQTQRAQENLDKAENNDKTTPPSEKKHDAIDEEKS